MHVDLSKYDNSWFNPGRRIFIRTVWHLVNAVCLRNGLLPFSRLKVIVLRLFGAKIGKGVIIKPSINVKYPWNLEIGDHSWIGEGAWFDSLVPIIIGNDVCISQGAYLCTGNHDWNDAAFGLRVKPIIVEEGAWIGAKAIVLSGITIASHSIITAGSVIAKDTKPYMIYSGNPATEIKERKIT